MATVMFGLASSIAVAAATTAPTTFADFALAHWQFYKPLTLPSSLAEGQLVELTLDQKVLSESNPGETDLRLIAGRDREVPYQLVSLDAKQRREAVDVDIRDLGYVVGAPKTMGSSSFVADVGAGASRHSEVEIATEDENFRRTVVVETSTDGESWAIVRDDGEIYNFTSSDEEFRVHHTAVGYPESAARYLRVKVLNQGEPPLEIDGASVFLAQDTPAQEMEYLPVSAKTVRDESGTTYHELDLGTGGVPVSRLAFSSVNTNFHRAAGVQGSDNGEDWQRLAETQLYALDTPKFQGSLMEIEFPESRYRHYRLAVDDADNEPLALTGYALHGAKRVLRFNAEPNGEYALYYGNPVAAAPSYDLALVAPYLETEDLPVATLGAQQSNHAFTGLDVPLTERLPWLMPLAIALAAVVVAALLFGVVRQAKKVLPPPGDGSASPP